MRWRARGAAAAAATAAMVLAACATLPAPRAGVLSGRIAVRVDATESAAARSVSAAFELEGDADNGALRLTSPLGNVVASARWAPGQAWLDTAQGSTRYTDLDALAREALGESLPLRALPDWLRGRPWAQAPAQAGVGGFDQLGWHISLARQAEGWIEATRAAAPAVNVRARLEPAS